MPKGYVILTEQINDPDGMKAYGRIWRVPLTLVIDRKGVLVKSDWYGNPGFDLPLLEATVTPLLRTP